MLRDLFRKSGRPLERELDLVPLDIVREHRFEDGSVLALPAGSRAARPPPSRSSARAWAPVDGVRRRPSPPRGSCCAATTSNGPGTLTSPRASSPACWPQPRDAGGPRPEGLPRPTAAPCGPAPRSSPTATTPATCRPGRPSRRTSSSDFGAWTVPGGLAAVGVALAQRLTTRGVDVQPGSRPRDVVVRGGRAVAVATDAAGRRRRRGRVRHRPTPPPGAGGARPAHDAGAPARGLPPRPRRRRSLAGPRGGAPRRPDAGRAHRGLAPRRAGAAWTVHGRGRLAEDVVVALARAGIDVRDTSSRGSTGRPATWSSGGAARRSASVGRAPHGLGPARADHARARGRTPPARTRRPAPGSPSSACRPRWSPRSIGPA